MATASVRLLRSLTQGVSRLYPLYSGCGFLANSAFYRFLSPEEELVETRLRDGSAIQVHLNDLVGRAVFFFGDLDPKVSWLCQRVLRPGDAMLDIGANYGLITMQAARIVGGGGQVHAFEPQPDLAALVRSSAERNGYRQVTVHNLGLSNADSEATLAIPLHNRGGASVSIPHAEARKVAIHLKDGSPYLRGLNLPRVRLIKVDVEGHETAVFEGARDWIGANQPEVIVFENNETEAVPMGEHPCVKLLAALEYDFFGLPSAKLRMRLCPMPAGAAAPHFHDVVAVHRGSPFLSGAARV